MTILLAHHTQYWSVKWKSFITICLIRFLKFIYPILWLIQWLWLHYSYLKQYSETRVTESGSDLEVLFGARVWVGVDFLRSLEVRVGIFFIQLRLLQHAFFSASYQRCHCPWALHGQNFFSKASSLAPTVFKSTRWQSKIKAA